MKETSKEIPSNIRNTPEYGWVKLLPCGVGDTVYRIQYRCHRTRRNNKTKLFGNEPWERRLRKHEVSDTKIVSTEMTAGSYAAIGHHIYLTQQEARNAMAAWLSNLIP